ncbi:hypothetical protein GGS23DRAFT_548718 [Durotheca rogersii]|uniref:uncharacterized protein n=1 Tax=Durotheca rogersii TaxID=419775 RepID=UPI00221FC88D|nr:uncharacterized protein GGS23DRAFT_548718 [Durotheca rogersii]KAI5867513.1 hypothetical protein GGS23DRAFT_548718 [Durotheca rogersii]
MLQFGQLSAPVGLKLRFIIVRFPRLPFLRAVILWSVSQSLALSSIGMTINTRARLTLLQALRSLSRIISPTRAVLDNNGQI